MKTPIKTEIEIKTPLELGETVALAHRMIPPDPDGICTAEERTQAQQLLADFERAEAVRIANDIEALERKIAREFRREIIFDLQKELEKMSPHEHGRAVGELRNIRLAASKLASILCTRLSDRLEDELRLVIAALESELEARGLPLKELSHLATGGSVEIYRVHSSGRYAESHEKWRRARNSAQALADTHFVLSGVANEFAYLRWFLGESNDCPL